MLGFRFVGKEREVMYGQNPVSRRRSVEDGMKVHSVFYTIQGEGPEAGTPAVFVRFSGCNLRCHFCDTDFAHGETVTPERLAEVVAAMFPPHKQHRIVLTGGEPMLQPLTPFVRELVEKYGQLNSIDIETAGTVWPEGLEAFSKHIGIVCSPKTPRVHARVAELAKAWKYIIKKGEVDPHDGLPNRSTQALAPIIRQLVYRPSLIDVSPSSIYVQPCDELDPVLNAANATEAATSAMQYGYKLSLQLHKIVGLP